MSILLLATTTAPGEARIEIGGVELSNQEIEISIQRGSDESFIGADGGWQTQPYWHRLHRLAGPGTAFRAGPTLVDALAEVASGDAFSASVRWDGGTPATGVLRIKGELITRPPEGPVPLGAPPACSIEIEGALIPADVVTIELALAAASAASTGPWCRLTRLPDATRTRFEGKTDEMAPLIAATATAPTRAQVRWGGKSKEGELRLLPQAPDRAGAPDRSGPRFLLTLDREPLATPSPGVIPGATKGFPSRRALALGGGAGLIALLGVGALAAWLMSAPPPGLDPNDPEVAEVPPDPPPGPGEVPESELPPGEPAPEPCTEGEVDGLWLECDDGPGGGGGVADPQPGGEPPPETAPPAPPAPLPPVRPAPPPPDDKVEITEADARIADLDSKVSDPEVYQASVDHIKGAARPNCVELLLLYSKRAERDPETAAYIARLYDPEGFEASTCIDYPSEAQAIYYYELASDGGITEADRELTRLRGGAPSGLAIDNPSGGDALRRFENRP
jgi:hypothetical protein